MSTWPANAAAASQEWEHIETQVLASAAASVSVTGISTEFRRFRVLGYMVKDATPQLINVRLNGAAAGNYNYQQLNADSTTIAGSRISSSSVLRPSQHSIAPNGAALFSMEIAKPSAGEPARSTAAGAVFADLATDAITWGATAGEWTDTADLINEIEIFTGAGSFAAGTRVLVGGARDSV